MRHVTTRRLTVAFATALAAIALPLVAPASPATAAAGPCLSEAQPKDPLLGQIPIGPACDDIVPPATTLGTVTPAVTRGWVRASAVTLTFTGQHTDADADPVGYQCQFFKTATAPTAWQACSSPVTYDKLEERSATPYTFRVRAVDAADAAHDITADAWPYAAATDTPDYDATPVEVVFRADATAPSTFGFLRSDYYDEDDSDAPMVTSPAVQIRLQSDEGGPTDPATYLCRLDDQPVACQDGITTLSALGPGRHGFTATAVDPAGNVDPTPFVQRFFVPRNLTLADAPRASRDDWRRVRGPGTFAGDYLQSTTYGATLRFGVQNIRAVRLLAPSGPGLGKVQLRVGNGAWITVDLAGTEAQRMKVYQVREELSGLTTGTLQVRVASRTKPVRIDAVMAR